MISRFQYPFTDNTIVIMTWFKAALNKNLPPSPNIHGHQTMEQSGLLKNQKQQTIGLKGPEFMFLYKNKMQINFSIM